MKVFDLLAAVPIPVGHRVEMQWYVGSPPHDAVVRDLETGIVYGPHSLFVHGWSRGFGEPSPLLGDVKPGMTLQFAVTGRVLACRVATRQYRGNHQVQTTLTVEPDPENASPYR